MTSDMAPLPSDDYMMLCLKLQAAAKLWNKAVRELRQSRPVDGLPPVPKMGAANDARILLDACIQAMGEPVLLGATEAGAG